LALIPSFSLYGAAAATLITQIAVFSVLFYFNNKYVGKLQLSFVTKSIFAALVMSAAVLALGSSSIAVIIPAGALVYFLVFYLIKGFSEEDKEIFLSIIGRKK